MAARLSRRGMLSGLAALAAAQRTSTWASGESWSYPIAFPGKLPGDGFFIKHGYGCENAVYYPGLIHTGENWYGLGVNAAGANVIAVAKGKVVYADFDYPGRVVIVEHADGLFSVYGHLDYELDVETGTEVKRGRVLGRVLARSDEYSRSHLHFEIRSFLTRDEVNGDAPRHGFTCGYRCPPGPGYWPFDAEHPSMLGWLNPTHVINRRLGAFARVAVPSAARPGSIPTWSAPPWRSGAKQNGELTFEPGGMRFPLNGVATGADDVRGRNARHYRLWYQIAFGSDEERWVRAALPADDAVQSDGEPAAVELVLIPAP